MTIVTSNCDHNNVSDCGHSFGDRINNQHVPAVNTKPQETEIHKNRENLVVRNSADSRSKIETTRVRNQIENRNEKLETKSRERNRSGVRIPLKKNYDEKMRNSKQRVEREIGPGVRIPSKKSYEL